MHDVSTTTCPMAFFLLLMSLLFVSWHFVEEGATCPLLLFFIRDSSTACPMAFFLLMMLVLLVNWPSFCLWFQRYLSNGILSIADVSATCPIVFFLLINSVSTIQCSFFKWRQWYLSDGAFLLMTSVLSVQWIFFLVTSVLPLQWHFFCWWRLCYYLSNGVLSTADVSATCPMAFFLLMTSVPKRSVWFSEWQDWICSSEPISDT